MTENSAKYGRLNCRFVEFYYESIKINVIQSGVYTFSSMSNMRTYGYLYKEHFNPYDPYKGLFSHNYGGCGAQGFRTTAELHFNGTYTLVVSTLSENDIGSFLVLVSSSNSVTFNHISKLMYLKKISMYKMTANSENFFIDSSFQRNFD